MKKSLIFSAVVIVINRMYVYCVYLLCVYIHTLTHIQLMFWKIYMRIHLYIKKNVFFLYTRACFCISIYIINVHSTQKLLIWMRLITIHNLTALLIFNHGSWFSVLLLKNSHL